MPFSDYKTALVTGASSGIGAAVVERLCQEGVQVHALARSADKLEALAAKTGCIAHAIDVTDLAGLTRLFETQRFDILVNNAGVDKPGSILKADACGIDLLIDVNLRAVLHLARLALPGMVERDCGHIINISSIAGSLPNQGIAIYSASKAFVDAFTTALFRELKGSRVYASVVRPGPVKTEFFPAAAGREAGKPVPAERFAISAELVAEGISSLLHRPRRVIYIPWTLQLAPWVEVLFSGVIDQLGPLLLR